MFGLDNTSGVNVMPKIAPLSNPSPLWFTEGGAGLTASYPGQDWFNAIQAELLAVLETAEIKPDKAKLNQLSEAIKKIVSSKFTNDAVPKTRKVNSKDLSADIALNSSDVGALPVTGGTLTGALIVEKTVSGTGEVAAISGDDVLTLNTANAGTGPHLVSKRKSTNVRRTHALQDKSGTLMHVGDWGLGSKLPPMALDSDLDSPAGHETTFFRQGGGEGHKKFGDYGVGLNVPYGTISGNAYFASMQLFMGDSGLVKYQWSRVALLTGENTAPIHTIYSTANARMNHNGVLISTTATERSDCPVGAPIPWPGASVPSGFLACNGQVFNKETYPKLALAHPSGSLPDLRGEFIRGLDAGRGVDSGRAVLSAQGDAMQPITGTLGQLNDRVVIGAGITGGAFSSVSLSSSSAGLNGGGSGKVVNFDSSVVTRTASETRPRNIAFSYIVRAA